MDASELSTLYDYYYWATKKILAQAEKVTPEQWAGPPPIGAWSLRETLVHTLGAERGWRHGWAGQEDPAPVQPADFPDAASLTARWREEEAAIAALPEADVTTPGRFAWLGDQALADSDFAGHLRDEHEPDIRGWLAGQQG